MLKTATFSSHCIKADQTSVVKPRGRSLSFIYAARRAFLALLLSVSILSSSSFAEDVAPPGEAAPSDQTMQDSQPQNDAPLDAPAEPPQSNAEEPAPQTQENFSAPPTATTPLLSNTESPADEIGRVPPIEAKTYAIKVLKRNSTNKIYFVRDLSDTQPNPGRILLLKKDGKVKMAVRVLVNYPEKKAFVVKRLKKYARSLVLPDNTTYLAVEKIGDLADDEENELDLEGRKTAFPKDLDLDDVNDVAEKPAPEMPTRLEVEPQEIEDESSLEIPDIKPMDTHNHWLTAGFGFIQNRANPDVGGSHTFSSGNVRYGYSLRKMEFFRRANLQDSITIEAGFYLYKALSYFAVGDAYTIISLTGTARYNLMFSRSFGIFFYAGLVQSNVVAANQSQQRPLDALSSILPAIGTGLLFQIGPSWYTRVDMGFDSVGLNLVLRF